MPAAAVIPAPIAYIKVVAVKTLVVGSREAFGGLVGVRHSTARAVLPLAPNWRGGRLRNGGPARAVAGALNWVAGGTRLLYFEKIRVFKAG